MPRDERNILDVLKFELNFVEKGGYGRSPREPWKSELVFEDSPTCMNYDCKQDPGPCGGCALIQFVPALHHAAKVPCRYIPLTKAGETLLDLYNSGTQDEIDEALGDWLRTTIQKLEVDEGASA